MAAYDGMTFDERESASAPATKAPRERFMAGPSPDGKAVRAARCAARKARR